MCPRCRNRDSLETEWQLPLQPAPRAGTLPATSKQRQQARFRPTPLRPTRLMAGPRHHAPAAPPQAWRRPLAGPLPLAVLMCWTPASCSPTQARSRDSMSTEVVLPLVVITELEAKRHHPELGYFARAGAAATWTTCGSARPAGRRYRRSATSAARCGWSSTTTDPRVLPAGFRLGDNDTRILSVARSLAAEGESVVLVSKDLPLRVKAAAVGLRRAGVPGRAAGGLRLDRDGGVGGRPRRPRPAVRPRHAGLRSRPASCPATPGWCCLQSRRL